MNQGVTLTEFNDMTPWRLEVYILLIKQELELKRLEDLARQTRNR